MNLSVLYGCDDNYAPYTGISLTSLFEKNREADGITVYLAPMDFSKNNMEKFVSIAKQYNRELVILDTEEAYYEMEKYNCGSWNGSVATWLRFFVLSQIPENVDKLVWIDSDTLIQGSLTELSKIDIAGYPVAAACDCISYYQRFRLGFDINKPYYNAGIIVFNLLQWRKERILKKMMNHLKNNIQKYLLNDQDLLNDFFANKIYKLPPQFNVQCFLMAYDLEDYYSVYRWTPEAYYPKGQIEKALDDPKIIHFFRFLGDYPWSRGDNYHPAKELYEEWKNKSLWSDHKGAEGKKELSYRVEKLLYRLLPRRSFLRIFSWYTNRGLPHKP